MLLHRVAWLHDRYSGVYECLYLQTEQHEVHSTSLTTLINVNYYRPKLWID